MELSSDVNTDRGVVAMRLIIPGDPVAWQRAGLNRKTGTIYTRQKPKSFETLVKEIAYENFKEPPYKGPVTLSVSFYFTRPKSKTYKKKKNLLEFKTTKPDLDNLIKIIMDSLSGIIYRDDAQIVMLSAKKFICGENDKPHTEIVINFIGEKSPQKGGG